MWTKTEITSEELEQQRDSLSRVVIKGADKSFGVACGFIIPSASVTADIMSVILGFLRDIASNK